MKNTSSHRTLSRRGSKLLVEVVIGAIGILGIMLAQSIESSHYRIQQMNQSGVMMQVEAPVEIDWLDILLK